MWYIYPFVAAVVFRLSTLMVSVRHETALKANGAVEYGHSNSNRLAVVHTLFYVAALTEAALRRPPLDAYAIVGIVIYLCSAAMLLSVMILLGPVWTVKLFIAKNHALVRHPLFLVFRHPNYFLAIIPELVGVALTMHAFWTLPVGAMLYAFPLADRIREETSVMKAHVKGY